MARVCVGVFRSGLLGEGADACQVPRVKGGRGGLGGGLGAHTCDPDAGRAEHLSLHTALATIYPHLLSPWPEKVKKKKEEKILQMIRLRFQIRNNFLQVSYNQKAEDCKFQILLVGEEKKHFSMLRDKI